MGLDDMDLRMLQEQILLNPQIGDVIQGTGGLRKMRFALPNRGKSGGARVLYVDFVSFETIYFILAYSKNVKEDLTIEEKNSIKKMIERIEETLNN